MEVYFLDACSYRRDHDKFPAAYTPPAKKIFK